MFLYRGSSRGMGGSPEDLGLLAVAGPQTYCGTLGQPAVCSCCQSPHLYAEVPQVRVQVPATVSPCHTPKKYSRE